MEYWYTLCNPLSVTYGEFGSYEFLKVVREMKSISFFVGLSLCFNATWSQIDSTLLESRSDVDSSQLIFRAHEDTLEVLADGIVKETQEERMAYCELFIKHLVKTLKLKNSFDYEFKYFENISVLPSGDDQFRIFTWQLEVQEGEYRYYGAIQMKDSMLNLRPLIDRSFNLQDPLTTTVSNDEWYGVVYYKALPFSFDDRPHYLLFGYDMYDFYNRRKVLDVLYFDDEGNPLFGAPVFQYTDRTENRFILEFAGSAQVRLNFDDKLGMVVYDNLVLREGSVNSYVPDGSYQGFQYKNDIWVHNEKIFGEVSDKPPHEVPLAEERLKMVKPDTSRYRYLKN